MATFDRTILAVLPLGLIALCGGQDLQPIDTQSLIAPTFQRSEIIGFLAGLGTTFAAMPDLIAMIKRRSTEGMNPRMAEIIGVFQILWVY
jgi:MtN3 and saliva related transmembrane protein